MISIGYLIVRRDLQYNISHTLTYLSRCNYSVLLRPSRDFALFGQSMNAVDLAPTVIMLYTNATVETTRATSKVGQNYFDKFSRKWFGFQYVPHLHSRVSLKGLLLCFFAGCLFTDAKRFRSSTIRNYVAALHGPSKGPN